MDRPLDRERPKIQLAEIELAAAGFRKSMLDQRGESALRGLLEVGRFAKDW